MKRWIPWALGAAALLLSGSCVRQYERVTVEEEVGFRGRAAWDPLFAAELLFEDLGVGVERPSSWRELPPEDHAILLPSHSLLAPVPVARLHRWVRRGGHLVVAGGIGPEDRIPTEAEDGEEATVNDPLLEPLGLALLPPGSTGAEGGNEGREGPTLATGRGSWRVAIDRRVGVALDAQTLLRVPAEAGGEPSSETTFSLVRVAVGRGRVTAVSDSEFLANSRIGDLDHAAFAWDLVAPPDRLPGGLTIYYRTGYLPWWKLLARSAWAALLSGAAVLALYLWNRGARFGPVSASRAEERRSLLEHVRATGRFLWRNRLGEVLLESARSTVLKEAARFDPTFSRLSERERVHHLAAKAGLNGARVAAALESRSVEDPAEFTRVMTVLESVRRASGGAAPQPPSRRTR